MFCNDSRMAETKASQRPVLKFRLWVVFPHSVSVLSYSIIFMLFPPKRNLVSGVGRGRAKVEKHVPRLARKNEFSYILITSVKSVQTRQLRLTTRIILIADSSCSTQSIHGRQSESERILLLEAGRSCFYTRVCCGACLRCLHFG